MSRPARKHAVLTLAALVVGLGLAAAAPPSGAAPPAASPAAVPPPPAGAAGVPTAAETWRVDGVHSSVVFRIRHMGVSNFYGVFKDMSGRIVLDEADASGCSVEFTLQAESVDTRNAKRDQHVMSPDFLNAKEFPEITFKSTKVTGAGQGKWAVEGELTLHGVTKPVRADAEQTGEAPGRGGRGKVGGFECRFEIRRSEFGMDNMLDALGDEVGLVVSVEAQLEG